ncbi:hypothetical protein TNCV_3057721 [Trichonephila clavipes]|nr:hypothetical protein TNCV_3057721 [Trichonephila clavipes]
MQTDIIDRDEKKGDNPEEATLLRWVDRRKQCLLQIIQGTCPTGRHHRGTHGPARRPDIRRDSEHGGQLVRYFPGRDNGGAGLGHGQGKRERVG